MLKHKIAIYLMYSFSFILIKFFFHGLCFQRVMQLSVVFCFSLLILIWLLRHQIIINGYLRGAVLNFRLWRVTAGVVM